MEKSFRNPLRPMIRFYDAYLFSKRANLNFKILIDCLFLTDDYENSFLKSYSIMTKKNEIKIYNKLNSSLETG